MANSNSKAAENALRQLLINMRNETRENHTQALANFKAAVQAYNKAQVNAVKAVTKAIVNPTVPNVNGVKNALETVTRAQRVFEQAAAAEATKVPIGKNNSKAGNNTGKKQGLLGRFGGAVRGVRGAVVGGARATRGAVAGGVRATGGALGGLFRPRSRPVEPNSPTARLIESTK